MDEQTRAAIRRQNAYLNAVLLGKHAPRKRRLSKLQREQRERLAGRAFKFDKVEN